MLQQKSTGEPGKLKNWKPEKLTALHAHPGCQDFRFSGFQVFTPHAAPEDLAR
jgi:hypothetical protein